MENFQASPLSWPIGWPRTKARKDAPFQVKFAQAREELHDEVLRMGGQAMVISCDLPVRRDGSHYVDDVPASGDPGVAVYFIRRGKRMVFACDRWSKVKDNIRAISKTIEAFRGIERWGASDMMERSLQAFMMIEPPPSPFKVLGLDKATLLKGAAARDQITAAYREKAKAAHPDAGGSAEDMAALTQARDDALKAAGQNG